MKSVLKRIACAIIAVVSVLLFISSSFTKASAASDLDFIPSFGINSESCILYSMDSERVIYEKNPGKQEMPGQLVDIMDAIIVLELCDDPDNTNVVVDSTLYSDKFYAYSQEYGYDDLKYASICNQDEFTVKELLYALMLTSSCEAAEVLANKYGSIGKDFVSIMNDKASEIGCTNTNFVNATGLYSADQYTTAEDMLKIVKYALEVPGFKEIANTSSFKPVIRNAENHSDSSWMWSNSNTMIAEQSDYYYEGAEAIKTAGIDKGGRGLVMMCNKGSYEYLLILLNAPFEDGNGNIEFYHLEDAIALFDWVYNKFQNTEILNENDEIAEIPVSLSSSDDYVLLKPAESVMEMWCKDVDLKVVQKSIKVYDHVIAPVKKGEKLGTIEISYNGNIVCTEDLVASKSIGRSNVKYSLYAMKNYPSSKFLIASIIVSLIISVIYVLLCAWAWGVANNKVAPQSPVHIVPRVEISSRNKNKKRKNNSKKKPVSKIQDPYTRKENKTPPKRTSVVHLTNVDYTDDDFKH